MIFEIVVPNILYYRLSFSLPLILSQDFNQLPLLQRDCKDTHLFEYAKYLQEFFKKKTHTESYASFMVMEDNFRAL